VLAALVLRRPASRARPTTSRSSSRRLDHPGETFAGRGCGPCTSAPGSASIRPVARCAWGWPRASGRGEKWLSSQNRNFENRMGDGSLAHLAAPDGGGERAEHEDQRSSPAAGPRRSGAVPPHPGERKPRRTRSGGRRTADASRAASATSPSAKEARAADKQRAGSVRSRIQRFGDNVDTDAIIPGQFCHLTRFRAGAKSIPFRRPDSRAGPGGARVWSRARVGVRVRRGAGGPALKGAGVLAIVARSYAFIHKRNLVNERCPSWWCRIPASTSWGRRARRSSWTSSGPLRLAGESSAPRSPRDHPGAGGEGGIVPAIQHHGPTVFEKLTA